MPDDFSSLVGLEDVKKICPKLKLLSRITMVIEEQQQVRFIPGETVQSYGILSVQPTTENLFQQICQTVECDVITFDMTSRMPFYIKHPQVSLAIEMGISFEIQYTPAIQDQNQDRHTIINALELIRVSRGRNVVISSCAERTIELRGPYDIVNLGLLFGLKQDQAKATISKNVRSLLYHGEARNQTVKGTLKLEKNAVSTDYLKRSHEEVEMRNQSNPKAKKFKVNKSTYFLKVCGYFDAFVSGIKRYC